MFVYATCITAVIGDDVNAICKKAQKELGIPIIPVDSEGFQGSKKAGYHAACDALFNHLIGTGDTSDIKPHSINILGDFNLAGEIWMIEEYYKKIGIDVVCRITVMVVLMTSENARSSSQCSTVLRIGCPPG